MHTFAVYLFFSFAVMGFAMVAEKAFHTPHEHWFLLLSATGIAMAWLAGFDMWSAWGVSLRYAWVGTTLTGFSLGASSYFVHEFMGFFSGLHRKLHDQAEVLEMHDLHHAA